MWNSRINVCDWPTVATPSPYETTGGSTGSGSTSYSYGKKKRSTVERKKRGYESGGYGNKNYRKRRPFLPFPPFPIGMLSTT